MSEHFADRLMRKVDSTNSQLVVGLDPRPWKFPDELTDGLERSPQAVGRAIVQFNEAVLDAVKDIAVAVKCQVAFYERYGCEGLRAYADTIEAARDRDLLVIGDVKRGDIGSTAEAYAGAHLPAGEAESWPVSADFHVDAITINPFLGSDGVEPFIQRANETGRGVFVLVKTSNPSSEELQNLPCPDGPVYRRLASLVAGWGDDTVGVSGYSNVGAVVGATFPVELETLREAMPRAVFLVPGFGAQGGGAEDVRGAFDGDGHGAVVNSSRGIIHAFRREPWAGRYGMDRWREAIAAAAEQARGQIREVSLCG